MVFLWKLWREWWSCLRITTFARGLEAEGPAVNHGGELPNIQIPGDGEQLPVDGEQLPVDGEQLPVDGEQLPVDSEQLPDDGEQLPGDGEQMVSYVPIVQLSSDGELPIIQLPGDGELLNDVELPNDIENLLNNTKEDLRKATEKIIVLQECLKSANEAKEASNAKYKEATKLLQKSEEEKLRQNCLASSIVLKIQNDDNKIRLFTGLPSYGVFNVLVTHLTPFVSKDKSLGSGLSFADEVLVTLLKLSQALTNQLIGTIFDIHETKVTKIFHRWINVMFKGLQPLVVWPDKEAIITHNYATLL